MIAQFIFVALVVLALATVITLGYIRHRGREHEREQRALEETWCAARREQEGCWDTERGAA